MFVEHVLVFTLCLLQSASVAFCSGAVTFEEAENLVGLSSDPALLRVLLFSDDDDAQRTSVNVLRENHTKCPPVKLVQKKSLCN